MKKTFLAFLLVCSALAAAAAATPQGAETYYRDGARFALEGRLAEAARAFEQAVALDPSNGNAHYALGNVYAETGRWADAVNAYYKAVSLNREDVEALNNLGVALRMRGQHKQAAAAFRRAVKIYPKWAEPFYHLAEAERALGNEEEAREAHERALRLRPDYATRPPRPFANARAGQTAGQTTGQTVGQTGGQILKAMNAVGVGPAGETSSAPARTSDGAAAANNANADRTPPNTSTQPRAATGAGANVATDAGASAAPRASAATPEAAPSPYELGLRESRAGRHREAVAALRQAVMLDRRDAAAHRALGDAYAALGEWRESVDAYEQAARLAPEDAETYQKLGRSYARLRESAPNAGRVDAAAAEAGARAPRPNAAAPAVEDPDPTAVYRIGPGDVLDIRALDGRDLPATSFKVTPTGLLDYPGLSAPLKVAGLTAEEASARLFAALAARPASAAAAPQRLAVGVREYASHAVIVGGMVKDPGTKILQREAVPLYVIVAHAQPLPEAGEAVVVERATGRSTAFDLSDAAALKTLVRPGDVITVRALPARFVYVAGAVREPGQKRFHAGMTLTQALLAAGGAQTQGGAASVATVTRQGDDGRLDTTRHDLAEIRAGRAPDPTLRAGDRVEALSRK